MVVGDQFGSLRRWRGKEQLNSRLVFDEDLVNEVDIDCWGSCQINHAHAIQTEIQKDPVISELEAGVHQADSPSKFFVQSYG